LLQSKKKLLKYKGNSTKLIYDDDGVAHEVYELQDEDKFRAGGDAQTQRAKFLETEAERNRLADVEDKELAKQKKREKKEKRKAKERALAEGEDGVAVLAGDEEFVDPFQSDDGSDAESAAEKEVPRLSKGKKHVPVEEEEDDSRKSKRSKKSHKTESKEPLEVNTLEDLEALATGLLA
jgi:ATP-dependent RNA helicase DDX10/DBP4